MEGSNIFDNDLRSRFEGFSPEPPADVWPFVRDAIVVTPPKRMLPLFIRVAAAIAFLAVSGLSVIYLSTDRTTPTPLVDAETLTVDDISPSPTDASGEATLPAPATGSSIQHAAFVPGMFPATAHSLASGPASADDLLHQETTAIAAGMPKPAYALALARGVNMTTPLGQKPLSLVEKQTGNSTLAAHRTQFPRSSNAQFAEIPARSRGNTGITLGMHVSPRYNDRLIADQGSLMSAIPFNMYEKIMSGYSYGASLSFRILPNLELQTGAGVAGMTQIINDINVWGHFDNRPFYVAKDDQLHPQNIMTSMGVIALNAPNLYFTDVMSERVVLNNETKNVLDLPEDPKLLDPRGEELSQSFSFIEIPLVARYRLLGSRYLDIYMKAGVAGNILTKNEVVHQSAVIGETSGVRSFSYSGIGGFALAVPLTSRLKLFVEPTAQMFLQPILTDDMLSTAGKVYPYSFTVASGLSFRF